jgi:hypothetical protein
VSGQDHTVHKQVKDQFILLIYLHIPLGIRRRTATNSELRGQEPGSVTKFEVFAEILIKFKIVSFSWLLKNQNGSTAYYIV